VSLALIDYGAGNLTSVVKGFTAAGAEVRVATSPDDLAGASGLVIPGVGHFDATRALDEPWRRAVRDRLEAGVPLLGICLGMQWLFEGSDEAPDVPGLGVFRGRCFRLPDLLKVPHVGWNTLEIQDPASRLLHDVPAGAMAYFTHSYAAPGAGAAAVTTHGVPFASAVERGRVFGTQFHPEKSGSAGLRMLANFVGIVAEAR
jgi:glutamine amidotransferase